MRTREIVRRLGGAAGELRADHDSDGDGGGLLLQVVQSYAAQTAARGAAMLTVDALDMVLIAVLVFLILRQIMPIAAAWPAALALMLGIVSRAIG